MAVMVQKATCSVDDLFNLHYHWCQDADAAVHGRYRVQPEDALVIQLIAYTSSRPGAIIALFCST